MHVENYIFIMTVHTKTKNVFIAKGHMKTHCKKKKTVNNYVKLPMWMNLWSEYKEICAGKNP